jgi:hypothetical protein
MKISTIALIAGAGLFAAASAFASPDKGKGHMGMDMDKMVESHFAEVDANGDGSVTEAEYLDYKMAKAKEKFAKMAGDDGVFTLEEAKAAHAAKMEEHKAKMKEHKGKMKEHMGDRGEHGMKGHGDKED